MKLKKWLREEKGMSRAEYDALEFFAQIEIFNEFRKFCQLENYYAHNRYRAGKGELDLVVRAMTPEELKELDETLAKERKRYEDALLTGGAEGGHYIAFHHR